MQIRACFYIKLDKSAHAFKYVKKKCFSPWIALQKFKIKKKNDEQMFEIM